MRKPVKVLIAAVATLGAMQLVTCKHENPPITGELVAPPDVQEVLRRACYDCHSHQTVWPWYSHVAPISWLVYRDVTEGRRHVNFSTWTALPPEKQAKKKKGSAKEAREGEMPPWFYLPAHPTARLTEADRATLARWAESP